ncbi:MAG: helix-turn-helix transcriptional regulator [Clostridia bacterium]|nr:helix-turn-helix transcriptional regulator [Clostridia bacterium]
MKPQKLSKEIFMTAVVQAGFWHRYFVSRREIGGSKPHSHTFFEFELILDGEATHVRNGRTEVLRRGTAYLLNPSEQHSIHCQGDGRVKLMNLSFLATAVPGDFARQMLVEGQCFTLDEDGIESVVKLLELLYEEETRPCSADSLYADSLLRAFFLFLLRYRDDSLGIGQKEPRVFRVLSYLHENFQNDISLSKLADVGGYSYGYLCQLIRQYTGKSFKQYLTDLRVGYAKRLILNTDLSLSEICYSSGFGSYSQFAHQFGVATGQSPDAYRKETREKTSL